MEKPILQYNNGVVAAKLDRTEKELVCGVSFHIFHGESLALIGETGSGKTLIAQSIMGVLPGNVSLVSGEISFCGNTLPKGKKLRSMLGREIVYIPQNGHEFLDPSRSIRRQLFDSIGKLGVAPSQRYAFACEKLAQVGFAQPEAILKQYPFQLSGGMAQRVTIALALCSEAKLLIADEPTTALDVTIQAKILELIRRIQKERGISVIYITHDLGVVAKVADYVDVMYAGKIVETGTIDEIFYDPKHPYTWGLLSAMPDLDTADDRLYTIPGSPPNLLHEKPGDAFAPRNRFALNIDDEIDPPMFKISDTHYAATWLLDPRAPKVEMPPELKERIARMKAEAKKIEEAE